MELLHLICPSSPSVWDGNRLSECFSNIVLAFGGNVVTIFVIAMLGITNRNKQRVWRKIRKKLPQNNTSDVASLSVSNPQPSPIDKWLSQISLYHFNSRMNFFEKAVFYVLPILGASLSFLDMAFLLYTAYYGGLVMYHSWLFRCSRFAVWALIILALKCPCGSSIFYNRVLCFWWAIKPLFMIPNLQATFRSLEVLACLNESCMFLVDVMLGVSLNIIRGKRSSSKNRQLEESLLSLNEDAEANSHMDSGTAKSYWDLVTFKSIAKVMNQGVIKQLDFEDLLSLPSDMDPSSCHDALFGCWQDQQNCNCNEPSLFKALCCAYGWSYFRLGLLKVVNDLLGFAGPLLLNKLIRSLQRDPGNVDSYVFAVSLGLTSIVKSFLDTQYTFHLAKLKLKLRSSIMTVIYKKCLSISLAEQAQFSSGEIQTFMSIDADRTVNLCNSFHDMWSLPLQIGVALYLLYMQVKFAFTAGVAITMLLIPVNKWISTLIAAATQNMMKQKDERIRRTGELLSHIRTLKMYGWELIFSNWLLETRSSEVQHLKTRKYLDAWCVFFWATTPTLISLFTFGLYTLMGHQLDAATVFTCLALFNMLISPLNSFPWVINGLIDAFISINRLSRFLRCPEHQYEQCAVGSSSLVSGSTKSQFSSDSMAVVMYDACCNWSSSNMQQLSPVIDHITLAITKGSLVAVIGEVGSGKSSLLNAILGEMRLIHGSISSIGSIAYVPQVPWIMSGTLCENVLFGKKYDSKRYSDTLQACALDVDISLMAGGDMAYIGEKGINLSGGQRARLALARAIYRGSDILMLDDVLSAVDSQVAQWILSHAILGPLTEQNTRVLCTHNTQAVSLADMVVVMDKGYVRWVGSPADLTISQYSAFFSTMTPNISLERHDQEHKISSLRANEDLEQDNSSQLNAGEVQEIIEEEERKEGKVEFAVYRNYAAFSGWLIAVIIFLSAISMQASRNGNDLWLSYWVDTTQGGIESASSTIFYLVVLCIFCIVNSILTLVRAFSFAYGGLRAAVTVHEILLQRLIDAPVKFFNQTPSGRILNRFSSDLYTIDDSLPFILNILLANFVGLLGIAVILSYVQIFFLFMLLPFWYMYSRLQLFYRSTSRELRRLDSVTRSPIYASFTETLDGSSTIRAFKSQNFFFTRFTEQIMLYQRTSLSELTASLWLSLRLQLLAAFIISFVAVMSVVGSRGFLPINFGTPGLVGLALSYAAPMVSLLGSFLTSFTETEKEMVSIERTLQYMDIPQEQLGGHPPPNLDWPSQGLIEFQHVTMRYMPSLPAALNDVTFTIPGGMQVGIVGRTGAGKSSVLNALFRLNDLCSGHILVDRIDIDLISARDLRSRFAIVPQSPFLFEGSLRDNMDPYRVIDDLKIWNALEKCHMKEEVEVAGGLDNHVKESGVTFSIGQRQLLCLARALLKSSKVLCLDECTACVDARTASILQNTISNECQGMTVITIAHRISTVLDMDNILVLDHGTLVEQGNPHVLLEDTFSRFSCFAKASTM